MAKKSGIFSDDVCENTISIDYHINYYCFDLDTKLNMVLLFLSKQGVVSLGLRFIKFMR